MGALITTGLLEADEVGAARRIVVAAFAGEPFAHGMFGPGAVDRFAGMAQQYAHWPDAGSVVMAARVAGHVVGVAKATLPGRCPLCDVEIDVSNEHPIEAEFIRRCATAHRDATLGPHAHISTVATDAAVQGGGVGRVLMEALVAELSRDAEVITLECLTTRARFYGHLGFLPVSEFDDPGGPGLRALLMQRRR